MAQHHSNDDMLTLREVAQLTGYTYGHVVSLFSPGNQHYDPTLRILGVQTDVSWRKAFGSKALFVFRRGDIKRWFAERQGMPRVQTYNRVHSVSV